MIEKLEWDKVPTDRAIQNKIDEVIYAVNALLADNEKAKALVINRKPWYKVHARLYPEEQKWLKKACWFWNDNETAKYIGVLVHIDTCPLTEFPFGAVGGQAYKHCKIIRPDDDVIYKGDE